jgi:hypothetical protein
LKKTLFWAVIIVLGATGTWLLLRGESPPLTRDELVVTSGDDDQPEEIR